MLATAAGQVAIIWVVFVSPSLALFAAAMLVPEQPQTSPATLPLSAGVMKRFVPLKFPANTEPFAQTVPMLGVPAQGSTAP